MITERMKHLAGVNENDFKPAKGDQAQFRVRLKFLSLSLKKADPSYLPEDGEDFIKALDAAYKQVKDEMVLAQLVYKAQNIVSDYIHGTNNPILKKNLIRWMVATNNAMKLANPEPHPYTHGPGSLKAEKEAKNWYRKFGLYV